MTESIHYTTTEEAISDTRGLFAALYDEDLPNLHGTFEDRDAAKDRLTKGMELLDRASDDLLKLNNQRYELEQDLYEEELESSKLKDQVEGMDIALLTSNLLHELKGRLMTDTPERTLEWITEALRELSGHEGDDADDVAKATTTALRLVV